MKIIRFCDRTPSVDRIKIGNEMDNLAESIRFDLPEWSDAVVSLYISNGKYSDVILLGSDRIYQPKREHTQHPGRWTAYLEAQRDDDVVWHSDTFALVIGDLPPTGEKVEQAYPTAIEEALKAATQVANDRASVERLAEQTGINSGIASDAAQRAERAAVQTASDRADAVDAADAAAVYANRAERAKESAENASERAKADADRASEDRSSADASAESAGIAAEKTAADREAAGASAAAAKKYAEQAAADAEQVAQDKMEVTGKVAAEVGALRDAILSGTKENAAYHLGFYLDENGELCEVEDDV